MTMRRRLRGWLEWLQEPFPVISWRARFYVNLVLVLPFLFITLVELMGGTVKYNPSGNLNPPELPGLWVVPLFFILSYNLMHKPPSRGKSDSK